MSGYSNSSYSIGGNEPAEEPAPQTVPISGVWLRRIGDQLEVLIEVEETWRVVLAENLVSNPESDGLGSVSHIVEAAGILSAPRDWNAADAV